MHHSPSNDSILLAVSRLETCMNDRFDAVDDRFQVIDDRFMFLTEHIASVGGQIAALRQSCISLVRKTDRRVEALIDLLRTREVISEEDRSHLAGLGPFSAT